MRLFPSLDKAPLDPRTRPWVIWVEEYPALNQLLLVVIKPRHSLLLSWGSRWKKTLTHHYDGPIIYSSHADRMHWIEEMIAAAKTTIPDNQRTMTALSLEEVGEIVDNTWKP